MTGIQDFLKYRSLSGLSVSGNGRSICFIVTQPVLAGNRYTRELWMCGQDGAGLRRLLGDGRFTGPCAWLDDETVGYLACGEGAPFYCGLNVRTGNAVELACLPEGALGAWMLADGSVVYLRTDRPFTREYPQELSFLKEHEDGFETLDEIPACFNGEGYVSGRRRALYLVGPDRKTVKVTSDEMNVDRVIPRPEGLYFAGRTYRGMNTEPGIYFLSREGGQPSALVPEGLYRIHAWNVEEDGTVVFAAHDKRVHIMSDDPAFYRTGPQGVSRMDIPEMSVGDGICHDCVYGEGSALAVRAGEVFFVTTRQRDSVIVKAAQGRGPQPVSPDGMAVTEFCLLPQGGLAMIAMGPKCLQELWIVREGAARKLTSFSGDCLRPEDVLPCETFAFSNQGFTVNCVVLKPADFDPSGRYPVIFYIHGGAKMCYTDVYFHEMQYLASSGYFVVLGNPRGSDGQGSGFARLLGHYGEPDYDDFMRIVDEALKRFPNMDERRMGVTGGSYGGILTNWVVTHTDRFRAAVAQRSICSMVSTFGTADNGFNFVREQMGGDLWNGFEDLWRQSPLKYAVNCRTPLLLIHSDEDYRCHYTEAMQMFTALKYLGVETEVCLIHGEDHGLSRSGRPVQRIKRLYEIRRWFDLHLAEADA